MSAMSDGSDELREATWAWWLALLIGLASVAAGVIVIAKPSNSLKTLAVIFGIFILLDGIIGLVGAIIGRTTNRGLLTILSVVGVVVGVLLIRHPLGGVRAVALLVGIWLIAAGIVRLVAAFEIPDHRVWRIGVALVLGIFGIAIVAEPHIGYATLAVITGIGFILYGIGMLITAWAMRTIRRHVVPPANASAST